MDPYNPSNNIMKTCWMKNSLAQEVLVLAKTIVVLNETYNEQKHFEVVLLCLGKCCLLGLYHGSHGDYVDFVRDK